MSKVMVVTDSCASIPEDLIEKLEINWVPYYIHRGSEVLRDLVTINREDFYTWLPTTKELPKTASPGPGDYFKIYEKLVKNKGAKEIISIHMTSKGSGAYQAAIAAKDMLKDVVPEIKVKVIDTLNVSMCHGWMAIEAAREALSGAGLADVANRVKSMIPITQMFQTADTLKYLYMGGRIGKAKHLVASLLDIKPIISMRNGEIIPLGQGRSRNRVYAMMIDKLEQVVGANGKIKVAYVHAAALDEAVRLKTMVEKRLACVESLICELTPALGVHTGPGTVGFCFFPVNE
jgi:DegV family protein with EDD domain